MSRGHNASRRRNYGPRQRDVRHRASHPTELDGRTLEWPRGSSWTDRSPDRSSVTPEALHRPHRTEAA
jgi:hypothetical protein